MSKVIKGGTVLTADRSYTADVKIDGGIISDIGENLSGDEIIDASYCYVMPGGIDPHTHLEMPFMGTTTAETWESGTFAALSGGTTTIIDMIVPDERGLLIALDEWLERANRQASCDFGFHMSITNWSEKIFKINRKAELDAIHVTIAYHEDFNEVLKNIETWNKYFIIKIILRYVFFNITEIFHKF